MSAAVPGRAGAPTVRTPSAPTPIGKVVGVAVALAAVVAVIVLAFSWTSVTAEPKHLPIAIAGSAPAVAAVETQLHDATGELLTTTAVSDRDAAVDAIRTRAAVGAIVLGEQPEVLTASAAGAAQTQVVTSVAAQLERALNAQAQAQAAEAGVPAPVVQVTVNDIVPFADADPRGTGLTAALFPMLLGGMIGGIAISIAVIGAMRRVVAVLVYSAAGGLVLAGILGGWFGSIQGDYWTNTAAIALSLAAIAAPITGFVALIGRAGIAFGPVVMLLFANPISGAALPPEFLPGAWGAVGQWFPPGASATLIRDLSYFPDASAGFDWLVLAVWAAAGLLLSVVGHFRTAGGAEPDAIAAQEAEAEPLPVA